MESHLGSSVGFTNTTVWIHSATSADRMILQAFVSGLLYGSPASRKTLLSATGVLFPATPRLTYQMKPIPCARAISSLVFTR